MCGGGINFSFPLNNWRMLESIDPRFLLKTGAITHPRWLLWQPFWILFLSINLRMQAPIRLKFLWWVGLD
jgi:hypothetical protein